MDDQKPRVLVVDDERSIRRFLRTTLTAYGYAVFEAAAGEEALLAAAETRPDVIILDLGLPDIDGAEVTRRLREWSQTPIVILSVREQEQDKVQALDAGADDYLTKPFGVGELLARLRAVMRRSASAGEQPIFHNGDLEVDLVRRRVAVSGKEVTLTPTEYDLLRVLIQNAGKVITHRQLIHTVWGNAYEDEYHLLRVNVSNLRRKIETDPSQPRHILTEAGVGYRLATED
ncbi:MAG: response regulator [Chloroflexi bacterium]|nr:response regulator [Chloroflexota bacterium]